MIATSDEYSQFLSGYEPSEPATSRIVSSTSSVLICTRNVNRKAISINNQSTATLYISFTNPATAANSFIAMSPGSFLMLDGKIMASEDVYGIWSSANGSAQVTSFS